MAATGQLVNGSMSRWVNGSIGQCVHGSKHGGGVAARQWDPPHHSMMHGILDHTSRIPPNSGSCEAPPPACPPPSRHRRVCQVIVFMSFFFYGFFVSILGQLGANLGQLGTNLGQHDAKKGPAWTQLPPKTLPEWSPRLLSRATFST